MTNKFAFSKKYLFRKMSLHKLFQSKLLISEHKIHYDQRIWGRNDFANLDNAVLLPPKNALFAPLLDLKPFLTMKK